MKFTRKNPSPPEILLLPTVASEGTNLKKKVFHPNEYVAPSLG